MDAGCRQLIEQVAIRIQKHVSIWKEAGVWAGEFDEVMDKHHAFVLKTLMDKKATLHDTLNALYIVDRYFAWPTYDLRCLILGGIS